MAHARKQIRDEVVSTCTGLTTTGSNVAGTRVYPLDQASLPFLAVYTTEETSDRDTLSPRLTRQVNVMVKGFARGTSAVDDTLDLIASEVEVAMGADATLNSLAKDSVLTSTTMELDGEGDNLIGSVELVYLVLYHTSETDPDTVT